MLNILITAVYKYQKNIQGTRGCARAVDQCVIFPPFLCISDVLGSHFIARARTHG